MTAPFSDRLSPRDAARAATVRGRFHDVVVAASKVLHAQEVDERDRFALKWASEMLIASESKEVLLAMPSAEQLSGPGNVVLAIRRATKQDGDDSGEAIRELSRGVSEVIEGQRSPDALQAMESLRAVFSLISRISLQAEVVSHGDPNSRDRWAPSTTTSLL